MKKHKFTVKMVSSVEPAAPSSVWGKGVPGKGGATTHATISETRKEKEKD